MPKVFVKDLQDKDQVDEVFLVKTKNTPMGKTGKAYLAVMLGDRTGTIDGRMWDNVESTSALFQVDDFIKVRGTVNLYQKRKQLVIHEVIRVPRKEITSAD